MNSFQLAPKFVSDDSVYKFVHNKSLDTLKSSNSLVKPIPIF